MRGKKHSLSDMIADAIKTSLESLPKDFNARLGKVMAIAARQDDRFTAALCGELTKNNDADWTRQYEKEHEEPYEGFNKDFASFRRGVEVE